MEEFIFELSGEASVSGEVYSNIIVDAGHSVCLPGLLVAGDAVLSGLIDEGGAIPLLRDPVVFVLIGATAGVLRNV